jgi:hypothetical protein
MRISEGDSVVSEALARPGPTHSVWDLLAAAVTLLARGPRVALLGFAAGGFIAPLRAMGWNGPVEAVDFDPRGERLFRRLASGWCGTVRFSHMEASRWLATRRKRFDVIIDDLSVPDRDGVTKPAISIDRLPALIRARLAPDGVTLVNTLALRGMDWEEQMRRLAGFHGEARVVLFEEFENRVLILGRMLPPARELSLRLRRPLRGIDSRLADRLSVRLWQRSEDS